MVKELEKALKKNKVMTANELMPLVASRAQLRRYANAGIIYSVGAGIYASPELEPFIASVLAVAKFYPNAVISNLTALIIYELSDERVDYIDVDIPRNYSIKNKLIKEHRVDPNRIIGVQTHVFNNYKIKIYGAERCLCESYILDPDGPLFLKAVKRYLTMNKINLNLIAEFDKILKTNVLRAIRQELADE